MKQELLCWLIAGLTAATLAAAADAAPNKLTVGNGCSHSQSPAEAGAEAARQARNALGGEAAKVVLVFDSLGRNIKNKQELLEGIATVFPASIVYGCSSYNPITQDSNKGTVAVLALAGGVGVVSAMAPVEGGHNSCGVAIGNKLKGQIPESKGRVLLLMGSCHVPANDQLVKGVTSVLGEKFPIAGGAASDGEFLYYQGQIHQKSNLGLLLYGGFKCGFSTQKGQGKEGVISSAGSAVREAIGPQPQQAKLIFAFDCGGRRGSLGDDRPKELQAMRDAAGKTPIFGFYGSGEIGPKDNDSPSRGVGFHLAVCAILGERE